MHTTDDIKQRLDLVSYIGGLVDLKKAGKHYKACCPFHDDKTPSFVVNPDTQTWRCFGACSEGGDIFTFYEKWNHVDFKTALQDLAKDAGIELPDFQAKKKKTQKHQRQLALLTDLADRYHKLLMAYDGADHVRTYLRDRGVTDDSCATWLLGYAPKQNIIPKLLQDYQAEDLLELGIAYQTESGQLRARFFNRLMIPIFDKTGQVVGFGARHLDNGNTAKYINSHESNIFHKSELLYGWHVARKEAQRDNQLVIVEGYMDVIQAHQAGYVNVVAQMGTALTDKQIEQIVDSSIQSIVVCLDGDEAGQVATDRTIEALTRYATIKDIRIVELQDNQDPDDLIQLGGFEQTIDDATPVVDYLLRQAENQLPDNPSLQQRHAIANKYIPKLYKLDDSWQLYSIQLLASYVGLNPMALVDMSNKLMNQKVLFTVDYNVNQDEKPFDTSKEAYLCTCLVAEPGWWWDVVEFYQLNDLELPTRAEFTKHGILFQQIIDIINDIDSPDLPADLIDLHFQTDEAIHDDFFLNILQLRSQHLDRIAQDASKINKSDVVINLIKRRAHLRKVISKNA